MRGVSSGLLVLTLLLSFFVARVCLDLWVAFFFLEAILLNEVHRTSEMAGE